jgi:phage-related protein
MRKALPAGHILLPECYNFLYIHTMAIKPLQFRGNALETLREFSVEARQVAGFQLDRVQRGLEPDDWKPMAKVGSGVKELRIREEAGAFRVIYLAKLAEAVYVLHCFQKKTEQTSEKDIQLARKRYKDLMKKRRT